MEFILRLILVRCPKTLLTRSRDLEKGKHSMHSIECYFEIASTRDLSNPEKHNSKHVKPRTANPAKHVCPS